MTAILIKATGFGIDLGERSAFGGHIDPVFTFFVRERLLVRVVVALEMEVVTGRIVWLVQRTIID